MCGQVVSTGLQVRRALQIVNNVKQNIGIEKGLKNWITVLLHSDRRHPVFLLQLNKNPVE